MASALSESLLLSEVLNILQTQLAAAIINITLFRLKE